MQLDTDKPILLTVKPCGDRILVQPVERLEQRRSNGGILLPDVAHEQNRLFYVCAVGSKVKEVKVGDRVVSHTYTSGMTPVEDGSGRGFLRESECMAVLPS